MLDALLEYINLILLKRGFFDDATRQLYHIYWYDIVVINTGTRLHLVLVLSYLYHSITKIMAISYLDMNTKGIGALEISVYKSMVQYYLRVRYNYNYLE